SIAAGAASVSALGTGPPGQLAGLEAPGRDDEHDDWRRPGRILMRSLHAQGRAPAAVQPATPFASAGSRRVLSGKWRGVRSTTTTVSNATSDSPAYTRCVAW